MAERGAQEGNQNRAKQYRIKRTLEAVLDRRSKADGRDALEAACEALLDKAGAGDVVAFKEVADRLDGKPAQALTLAGDEERPLVTKIIREIVRAPDSDAAGV